MIIFLFIEIVLLGTHNKCFGLELRKLIFNFTLFYRPGVFGQSECNGVRHYIQDSNDFVKLCDFKFLKAIAPGLLVQ